jgi:hypothetical protein
MYYEHNGKASATQKEKDKHDTYQEKTHHRTINATQIKERKRKQNVTEHNDGNPGTKGIGLKTITDIHQDGDAKPYRHYYADKHEAGAHDDTGGRNTDGSGDTQQINHVYCAGTDAQVLRENIAIYEVF